MHKEFTASAYIIHEQKVLLIFHEKFQKWLPPGGHVESNETPAEAAIREVLEETGLEIEFIQQENLWINYPNATSFARPYACLLENVPVYKDKPAHQHIDFVYIARPLDANQTIPVCCKWFTHTEILKFQPQIDIFQDSLDIIKQLLNSSIC